MRTPVPPFHCPNIINHKFIVQCLVVWYACVIQENFHTPIHIRFEFRTSCASKILEVAYFSTLRSSNLVPPCRHTWGSLGSGWPFHGLWIWQVVQFVDFVEVITFAWSNEWHIALDGTLRPVPRKELLSGPFRANSRHSMASLFWIDLKNWKVQWRCNLFLLTFVLKWSLVQKNHQSNLCTWYTFVWITEIPWLSLVWALALRVAPPVAEAAAPNLSSPSANGSHRRSLFIFGLGSIEIHEFFAHQAFPSVIFVQLVYDLAKTWTWHSGGCKKKRQRRSGHRVNSTCANSHHMVWCCVNLKWLSSRVHRFRYRHSVFWRDVTGRSSEIRIHFSTVFFLENWSRWVKQLTTWKLGLCPVWWTSA